MATINYSELLTDIEHDIAPQLATIAKSNKWDSITQWLARLFLLKGVPFRYLLPDERILPKESIKYFQIDQNWLTALLDGAFSIGRTSTKNDASLSEWLETRWYSNLTEEVQQKANAMRWSQLHPKKKLSDTYLNDALAQGKPFQLSGFLLRSQALVDFPNMQIVGYDQANVPTSSKAGTALPLIRLEHLGDDVLIAIFVGQLYRVDFREPSEGLHYGLDSISSSKGGVSAFAKKLRDANGMESSKATLSKVGQLFRPPPKAYTPAGAVLNMNALSEAMFTNLKTNIPTAVPYSGAKTDPTTAHPTATPITTLTSADFALQMTEGAAMVSFNFKNQ